MWLVILGLSAVSATLGGLFMFYRGAYKRFKTLFEHSQTTITELSNRRDQLEEVAKYQYDKIREYEEEFIESASADDLSDGFNELSKKDGSYGPN